MDLLVTLTTRQGLALLNSTQARATGAGLQGGPSRGRRWDLLLHSTQPWTWLHARGSPMLSTRANSS